MWEKIKLFGSKVFEFLLPLIKTFAKEGGLIALQLAFEVIPVIAMTHKGKSGDEKRAEAFKQIMDVAKTKGITLSTSMVNAAIEAAVAKIKE